MPSSLSSLPGSVAPHIRNVYVDEDEATPIEIPRLAPDIYTQ